MLHVPLTKADKSNEWLIVVADGHGALGHNVSQMIVETMHKTFEENKRKFQKQVELARQNQKKP